MMVVIPVGLMAEVVTAAVRFLAKGVHALLSRLWGEKEMPATAQTELSETDQEKIEATWRLMEECFGPDAVGRLKKASNRERIELMADFAERLAREYDLDIDVDVTVSNIENCGSYNWKDRKAVFNIALLMVDGSHEQFEFCVRETLDTIVHELRHAVQHKCIRQPGFWNIDENVRAAWAQNMAPGHYIPASVDLRGYASQPIEQDAATFAAQVMKGVR